MLVRLMEYNTSHDDDNYDKYNKPMFIKAYEEESFDQLVYMLTHMKNRIIKVGDDIYLYDDFIYNFPPEEEYIPSIDIYVTQAY